MSRMTPAAGSRSTRQVFQRELGLIAWLIVLTVSAGHARAAIDPTDPAARAARAGDYAAARDLLQGRAEQGDADAQLTLGVLFASGRGGPRAPEAAVRWYRRAAEQGNASAENNLGRAYLDGEGVSRDPAQAAQWFRKAATQGDAGAQYNLGTLYAQGRGVGQDMNRGGGWWRKAAEQGVVPAQYNMGVANADGVGVEKSEAGAVYWFANAAAAGNMRAGEALARHVRKLPTKQVAAARVNVRSEASTETPAVARLDKGVPVPVLGRNRAMVYLPNRQTIGWVASRLLSRTASQ